EGALTETHSILQRMRDLAVQASNGGSQNADAQKAANLEFTQLRDELDRIATNTTFGTQKLLDGTYNGTFQIGANATQTLSVAVGNMGTGTTALNLKDSTSAATLGDHTKTAMLYDADGADGTAGNGDDGAISQNVTAAQAAITKIDSAIAKVSEQRATLGAFQNRFEHTINNLNVAVENLSASESRIRDTDMAQEMVSFTRNQILTQAGTSMLAQANQSSQGVLKLLG
ncbi:flagellin, partial [Planomonospora venezuelensis]